MSPQPLQLVHVDPTIPPSDGDVPVYDAATSLYVPTAGVGTGNVIAGATLTSNQVVIGQGTTAVATLGSLGTTTTLLHGNAAGAPTFGSVVEADITLADNTTNNCSTSAHGFLKKLDNSATTFMNGQGNWATPAGSASRIVQVVNTQTGSEAHGTTTIPTDDTIPQKTEGTEFMTLAITPTSATNKLLIEVVVLMSHNAATSQIIVSALFQDTTDDALAVGFVNALQNISTDTAFKHYMTSGTTSATTFKIRCGTGGASTVTLNGQASARLFGGSSASSITITEILV